MTVISVPTGTDELLDGLNDQQRQAVLHEGSPLLIVAGAGSGKTAVLTRRIAYLLAARDVGVGQVLAITFTNKAAAEMRERVVQLIGPRAKSMWVSTFHSTCVRILRNQASLLPGLNSNFSIYDSDDSRRLLMMIGKDMGIDTKRYSPRLLANGISNLKNELIEPQQAAAEASEAGEEMPRIIADVFGEYQRRLRAANALDFDDLIGETVAVLQAFPQIAQYYRRRFRHILVDEYQDTNHAQYVLVRELVGGGAHDTNEVPPAELCVVGDADQSIYAFRGATIRNIEDFERDYPNATTILLEQNYRSTQNILSAANAVISRNAGRREKRLWTDSGEGELIVGYVADNEHDEARFVAGEIDALSDRGDITYNDVAVFYRTNNSSRAIEEVFIRAGIPYKVVGGVRFYERKEIRDIVAYLRVLDNPGDAVSMRRILNTPRRGIGDRAEACVAVYAENTGASFNDALQAAAEGKVPMLNTRAEKMIAAFVELLDELRGKLGDELGDLVEAVFDRSGYRRELESSSDPQDLARLDNLNELVSVAHEFSIDLANAAALREESDEAARRGHSRHGCTRRVPGAGVAGRRRRRTARAWRRRRHHDDVAHRQGARVPGGLRDRLGGRHVPAHAGARRPNRTVGGAQARIRRHHPGPTAVVSEPGQGPLILGPAHAQPGVAVPPRDSAGAHRLAPHGGTRLGFECTRQRRRSLRHPSSVTGPHGRVPQPAVGHAGAGRPRQSRQVRAGPRRGGIGRR